jgi:hypothetical protein
MGADGMSVVDGSLSVYGIRIRRKPAAIRAPLAKDR